MSKFQFTLNYILLVCTCLYAFNVSAAEDEFGEASPLYDITYIDGSYRTASNGNWYSVSWEIYQSAWTPSPPPPANTTNPIFIKHSVNANSSLNLSTITIQAGGSLTISANSSFSNNITIDSAGLLQIDADVTNNGVLTVDNVGKLIINNPTISGVSPVWNGAEDFKPRSILEIRNWLYNAAGNNACLIQNPSLISTNSNGFYFGNLVINANPSKLFVLVAGSQTANLCESSLTTSVLGSFGVALTNSDAKVTIGGDIILNTGPFSFASTSNGNAITTVQGNINCLGGSINLNAISSGSATSTVQVFGNTDIANGAALTSTDGGCKIVFTKQGEQTVSIAGTLGTNVAFEVASGSTTKLLNRSLDLTNPSNKIDILAGGALDFNGFDITGAGDFNLVAGGKLKITSPLGVNTAGNNTGNIQNSGRRSFSQAAYYQFTGSSSPQATGTAMTAGSSAKRIIIDKTNSTDIVNVTQSTGTTDTLIILNGTLVETEAASVSGSGSLSMYGGTYKTSVTSSVVPQMSGVYNLQAGTIELNSSFNQILRGSQPYRNLTFSTGGVKTVTTGIFSIIGAVKITDNVTLDATNNTIGGDSTDLIMVGNSKLRMAGTGPKPDARGKYNLDPLSTIIFANNAATTETIRLLRTLANIEITGTNVGVSTTTGSIDMQAGTKFTVRTGGTFKVQNTNGLSGSTTTAINSTGNPSIILEAGSTIEYNKPTGSQIITARTDYSNLALSGSSAKVMSGAYSVAGNFVVSGGLVTAPSMMRFIGSSGVQSISGIDWNDIDFSGSAMKQFTSDGSLGGNLTMTGNNILLDADGSSNNVIFTLKSTSISATARIADLTNSGTSTGNTIVGNVTVERFIPAKRAYRLISPSVTTTGTIRDNWMNGVNNSVRGVNNNPLPGYGTHITGKGGDANHFDVTATNNPSLFYYDNSSLNWSPQGSADSTLKAGFPLRLFVRGDRSIDLTSNNPPPTATILKTRGLLYVGDLKIDKSSRPIFINPTKDSFSLVGNPYASPLDWEQMVSVSNNSAIDLYPSYTAWDPNVGTRGAYVTYNAITQSNNVPSKSAVNKNIQPGQAFFVQAKGPNPTIIFKELYKVSGNTAVFRTPAEMPKLSVNLTVDDSTMSNPIADGFVVVFDESFKNSDGSEDAPKYKNQDENIAINNRGSLLSIEGRPPIQESDTIQLGMGGLQKKSYFLQLDTKNFLPEIAAFVEDSYLNKKTSVNFSKRTEIPFSITNDSASFAASRFKIVFTSATALTAAKTIIKAYEKDGGVEVEWATETEAGINAYEVEKSVDGRQFERAFVVKAKTDSTAVSKYGWFDANPINGSNYYRIKTIDKSNVARYTNEVAVTINNSKSGLSIYPNPVRNKILNVRLLKLEKGTYTLNLYSNLGQKVYSTLINHNNSSATYNINIAGTVNNGVYRLSINKGKLNITKTITIE